MIQKAVVNPIMKQRHIIFIMTGILLFAGSWGAHGNVAVDKSSLAGEFSLYDQFGKLFRITYPQQKIRVLIFADRKGVNQVEDWVRSFYETYQDAIDINGVAKLEGVPKWLRFTLKRIFKSAIKYSVMMDWTGDVCRLYGYPGGKAFVVIVDRKGNIRHTVNGKASEALFEECRVIVDELKPFSLQASLP